MADAAYVITSQPISFSGKFLLDEAVLRAVGKTEADMKAEYSVDKEAEVYMLKPGYWHKEIEPGCGLAKL